MVTNMSWTLYPFLMLVYLLLLIKLVEFTNNSTLINLLIEPIDNYGLIVVVIMCRWFMFVFDLFCECVIGHELSAFSARSLITTYPSTQGEEDEGVDDQVIKIMDIINTFKL